MRFPIRIFAVFTALIILPMASSGCALKFRNLSAFLSVLIETPTVTAVNPANGGSGGGTVITITGSGFLGGAYTPTVTVDSLNCSSVTVVSFTSLTCHTPAHAVGGPYAIAVTQTDGKSGSLNGAYTYTSAPTLISVSLAFGPLGGGQTVTFTGTGFAVGIIARLNGVNCATTNYVSATSLTCVTPAGSAGVVDASIVNLDTLTGSLASAYTYVAAPTVASISPTFGLIGGGQTITFTGTGFRSGIAARINGVNCATTNYVSATSLTCVTPAGGAGTVGVSVVNADTQTGSLAAAFTYLVGISPGTWTWMSGSTLGAQKGVLATATGVMSTSNIPGGRVDASSVVDSGGSFWLMGGVGKDLSPSGYGYLQALWKFDPSTLEWGHQGGVIARNQVPDYAAPAWPGNRATGSLLVNSANELLMFGGIHYDTGSSSYRITNGLWQMLLPDVSQFYLLSGKDHHNDGTNTVNWGTKGTEAATNMPGSREAQCAWVDNSDNLWVFGGHAYYTGGSAGRLNDLWRYRPSTSQWTWMNGVSTNNPAQVGTLGVSSATATPAGNLGPMVCLKDSSGNFWMFGGMQSGRTNILWKFNPTTNEWTWVKGPSTVNGSGVYGTQGVAAAGNIPGARLGAAGWMDASNRIWIFGGSGYDEAGTLGYLNDLWVFDTTSGNWAWIMGPKTAGDAGSYGTLGVSNSTNLPPARSRSAVWLRPNGEFWLFGGDSGAGNTQKNDIWRYVP